MAAKDRYHDAVVHALQKAGWLTTNQVALILTERRLWIDVRAEHPIDNVTALVEIKGFENTPSPVEYLAETVGKYVLYQGVLDYLEVRTPLYLAIPQAAYEGIFAEEIGWIAIQQVAIRFLVFDPIREEIVQWI